MAAFGDKDDKIAWALTHGIIMDCGISANDSHSPLMTHAPFALDPFPLPRLSFEKAVTLATVFNELIDKISRDSSWIMESLKFTVESDTFTRKLLDIFIEVVTEGRTKCFDSFHAVVISVLFILP